MKKVQKLFHTGSTFTMCSPKQTELWKKKKEGPSHSGISSSPSEAALFSNVKDLRKGRFFFLSRRL